MRHYLIYSQSDQQTLRDPRAERAYDAVAVPGTVAAYFPEATASFILATRRPYFIDVKTPLFQGPLVQPRPSHIALANTLSPTVAAALVAGGALGSAVYTEDVIHDLLRRTVEFQTTYHEQASAFRDKLAKYARLLAEARGEQPLAEPHAGLLAPEMILAPYFCARAIANDPWLDVDRRIWAAAAAREDSTRIVPVVALDSEEPSSLEDILSLLPDGLSRRVIFWLTGFDERSEPRQRLSALWKVVRDHRNRYDLINLYGGYFSVMLQFAGLAGFSNGIGYSESRRWPELASSGAAPARYYVPLLHAFLSPGDAQLLVDQDPWFACPCDVCAAAQVAGRPAIVALSYHDLKKHFVLARQAEIDYVRNNSLDAVLEQLEDAIEHADALRRAVAARDPGAAVPSRFPVGHLAVWREAAADGAA